MPYVEVKLHKIADGTTSAFGMKCEATKMLYQKVFGSVITRMITLVHWNVNQNVLQVVQKFLFPITQATHVGSVGFGQTEFAR